MRLRGSHVIASGQAVTVQLGSVRSRWLIFSHACDLTEANQNITEIINFGALSFPRFNSVPVDQAADYVFVYEDGTELSVPLWRRHQIGPFTSGFGENCFQAVSHIKPVITRGGKTDMVDNQSWGWMSLPLSTYSFSMQIPFPQQAMMNYSAHCTIGRCGVFAVPALVAPAQFFV